MPATPPNPRAAANAGARGWRAPLLDTCLWVAASLGSVWMVSSLAFLAEARARPETYLALGALALLWVATLAKTLPEGARLAVLSAFNFGLATLALRVTGPTPGPVLLFLLAVLTLTLFHGKKGGALALGAVGVIYVATARGWISGELHDQPDYFPVDQSTPRYWLRLGLTQLLGSAAIVTSVVYVLNYANRTLSRLRESEEKFSKAFQASPNAITITDVETGRFVDVNEGYTRLFGFTRGEVLGRTALEVGMWQDPDARARLMAQLRENGSIRDFLIHVKNRDGQPFTMLLSADRIELGGTPHYVSVGLDITARVEAEQALRASEETLRRLNVELEQRVADRTAQLTAANAELESFSYSVSHDLRSPLRAIDGFSKALSEDFGEQLGEEGQDYLRRVRAASQRMGQLIDDLLQLSRAARVEMHREPVHLSSLGLEIVSELRERQPEPAVAFECASDLVALADPVLARVALDNLLHNAWKYTRKKPAPRVELGRAVDQEKPGEVVFFVRDNGAGFDMRYSSKLFSPFQRLHPASEFEGTGIGLATVRRITTRHGGRVWAESVVGEGTIVYFSFAGVRV